MMDIIISGDSDKPIYQQLYDQISSQIIKGQLKGEQILPSIRTVAKELRVSVITVKKAWEDLERSGFIYTMVGRGCFIAKLSKSELMDKRNEIANKKLSKDIEYYKKLGLSLADIKGLIEKLY